MHWKSLIRSQIAAFAAAVVDWGVTIGAVELLHFYPVWGVGLGAFSGAVTNFFINRHWSFEVGHHPVGKQAWRYAAVSIVSLFLNTYGVYFLMMHISINYIFSKAIISTIVAIFYNYPLHRYFVYGGHAHESAQSNPA